MIRKAKHIFSSLTKNLLFYFVIFYLAFHLFNGENGFITYIKQQNQLAMVTKKYDQIEKERLKIKNKVERLYSHSLDADLLDEQLRRNTGKIKENEVIYYY